jgi:type VI secretion system protein ImpH
MADKAGPAPDFLALQDALAGAPHRFGFFETLRRLENAHRDLPRLGQSARPADDPVRLGQKVSLAFSPSTLAAFHPREGKPPRLDVAFLGLFGPNGPLPTHLSEYVHERVHNANDPTFARFADMFHHRLLSLFYRAWALTQPTVDFDRPETSEYVGYVGSLLGIGRPALRGRDAFPDPAKLHFGGRLASQTRNAEGLVAILAGFLRLPVTIDEFVGEWIGIPADSVCRLGKSRQTGSLGTNTVAGERMWSAQHKFRLRIGPMAFKDYQRLLPTGASLPRLVAAVRNYLGDEFAWDLNLVLLQGEVPSLRLGSPLGLGWSTWLGRGPFLQDAADLRLRPIAHL